MISWNVKRKTYWLKLWRSLHMPLAAQRLIGVIKDDNNTGYVVVQADESLFSIIDRVITYRENLKHIKKI